MHSGLAGREHPAAQEPILGGLPAISIIDGKTFESPSGAGRYVKGAVTNGWSFWRLQDGRKRFGWSGRGLHSMVLQRASHPAQLTSDGLQALVEE